MNYFIAIVPKGLEENTEAVRLLAKFKRTLSDKGKEVRWTSPKLWHVTLRFLGPLKEDSVTQLKEFLHHWTPSLNENLVLRIQGVGAFPEPDHARVLWFGVQQSQTLLNLQSHLESDLGNLLSLEPDRGYVPHLTLARFRNLINVTDLVQLGGRRFFGDYPIGEVILFQSVIQGKMTKYVPLFRKMIEPSSNLS